MVLTKEEQRSLDEAFAAELEQDFKFDEFYAMQPEIFEAIEDGDLDKLTKLLEECGGY